MQQKTARTPPLKSALAAAPAKISHKGQNLAQRSMSPATRLFGHPAGAASAMPRIDERSAD
jgi:hypothetical protein